MYWVLVKDHFWQGFLWYMRFQTHLQATVAGQDEITLNLHTSVHRNYENARLIQLSKMRYFVICWLSPDVLLVEMSRIHWILKACLWLHSSTQIIQACTPEMLAIIYACFVLSWQCKFQAEFGESRVGATQPTQCWMGLSGPPVPDNDRSVLGSALDHLEQWSESTIQERCNCKTLKRAYITTDVVCVLPFMVKVMYVTSIASIKKTSEKLKDKLFKSGEFYWALCPIPCFFLLGYLFSSLWCCIHDVSKTKLAHIKHQTKYRID